MSAIPAVLPQSDEPVDSGLKERMLGGVSP